MGSVTGYEPSHPLKQRKTAEYGTREPYYRSLVLRPRFLALASFAFLACSREQKRPERTEPWPAASAVPSASASPSIGRASFSLEKSTIDFELPAKRTTPRGRFPAATGHFDVDLERPERSSGSVRIDLTQLELVDERSDGPIDASRRGLEWLELGSGVSAADRETRRIATFVVHGLEGAEGKSLARARAHRDGKPPHFEATVVGELSLHGVRAPARVPVSLEIVSEEGRPESPTRLVIRSRKPLVVSLSVHDIRPRDARGVLVARELALLGENVGREAKVSFELTLAREPPKP
jgi:polyisoprenoid-binding protein YceI